MESACDKIKQFVCKHCSDEEAVFDTIKHLRTHIRRIHKSHKQQYGESASATVENVSKEESQVFERPAIEMATELPIADVTIPLQENVKLEVLCNNDQNITRYPMVELDLESAIDDTVLAGTITHDQLSSDTVCHQLNSPSTLDHLIDEAIARDRQDGVTLHGQLFGIGISKRQSSSGCVVVDKTKQSHSCVKSSKNTKRSQQKAKFDNRRRAALRCNGRIITAVVAELHSMISSGSAILKSSDDQAIEQLRKMDRRPPRKQLPKEVYLTMLITARQFVPVETAQVALVKSMVAGDPTESMSDSVYNDVSMHIDVREVEPEAMEATAEFCADLQKEPDVDKDTAEWMADVYKSYGSCITQFPESDGSSSLDGLNLTSDVEGELLPCPRRRPYAPTKKKTVARHRYRDSRRADSGVMTRCWTTNSFRRIRPDDMKMPSLPRGRRTVERAAREFRQCFAPYKPRRRKAVAATAVRKPNLRSVVTVPMQSSSK